MRSEFSLRKQNLGGSALGNNRSMMCFIACCGGLPSRLEHQDICLAKSEEMFEQETAAGKKPSPVQVSMSREHREVIAKFGR